MASRKSAAVVGFGQATLNAAHQRWGKALQLEFDAVVRGIRQVASRNLEWQGALVAVLAGTASEAEHGTAWASLMTAFHNVMARMLASRTNGQLEAAPATGHLHAGAGPAVCTEPLMNAEGAADALVVLQQLDLNFLHVDALKISENNIAAYVLALHKNKKAPVRFIAELFSKLASGLVHVPEGSAGAQRLEQIATLFTTGPTAPVQDNLDDKAAILRAIVEAKTDQSSPIVQRRAISLLLRIYNAANQKVQFHHVATHARSREPITVSLEHSLVPLVQTPTTLAVLDEFLGKRKRKRDDDDDDDDDIVVTKART